MGVYGRCLRSNRRWSRYGLMMVRFLCCRGMLEIYSKKWRVLKVIKGKVNVGWSEMVNVMGVGSGGVREVSFN